jgi:hypothetical protein
MFNIVSIPRSKSASFSSEFKFLTEAAFENRRGQKALFGSASEKESLFGRL